MTDALPTIACLARRAAGAARAFHRDARAVAAVETALILPVALTMLALVVFGAEGFAIQRKVTLTARTVTDLVTQATPNQLSSGASLVNASSIDQLLQLASSVLAPYANANLAMVVSEVVVNSDQATATVQWSEPCPSATCPATTSAMVRPNGQKITLPTGFGTGQAGNYFVLGEVSYNYTPLNLFTATSAMVLHDSIYLTPRKSNSITCDSTCASHG